MPNHYKSILIGGLVGIILALLAAYFTFRPDTAPTGAHMEATPAPELRKEETVDVVVAPPIKVYKPQVKEKLNLPDVVKDDPRKHVVASTRTPADERAHTVTTLLDESTGKFVTYDRAEPPPWVAVNTRSEVGVYYGLKRGEQVIRLEGRQTVLQVKAVHVGAVASADIGTVGSVDTFVGVGAWARW